MNMIIAENLIFISFLEGVCVLSLIVLLICKELLRAYNGPGTDVLIRKLNIVIAPFLTLFGIIILLRLIQMF
jgi:hypothetical protein